jgi:hypothetical protein
MPRAITGLVVLGLMGLTISVHPLAQSATDPWYGLQPKPQNFDEPKVFTGTFQIQLPKGWHLAPGHTNARIHVFAGSRRSNSNSGSRRQGTEGNSVTRIEWEAIRQCGESRAGGPDHSCPIRSPWDIG